MKRTESELPAGAVPLVEAERGQELVFVTENMSFGTWRAPYCGPTRHVLPRFRATREQLAELEGQLLARTPAGSTVKVQRLAEDPTTGMGEWTAHVAVTSSGPMLAGE